MLLAKLHLYPRAKDSVNWLFIIFIRLVIVKCDVMLRRYRHVLNLVMAFNSRLLKIYVFIKGVIHRVREDLSAPLNFLCYSCSDYLLWIAWMYSDLSLLLISLICSVKNKIIIGTTTWNMSYCLDQTLRHLYMVCLYDRRWHKRYQHQIKTYRNLEFFYMIMTKSRLNISRLKV